MRELSGGFPKTSVSGNGFPVSTKGSKSLDRVAVYFAHLVVILLLVSFLFVSAPMVYFVVY
jgi:hypothetical protein